MTAARSPRAAFPTNASAESFLTSTTIFFEYLTTAVALSRDRSLVRAIRERSRSSADRVLLAFGQAGPFLHLTGDEIHGCSIELPRTGAHGAADVVDLAALFSSSRPTYDALVAANERMCILPEVAGWLRAFASGGDTMARETFRSIAAWHPLLAMQSYRQLTQASMALDVERRDLLTAASRREASPQALRSYWALIHLVSNASLVATMGDEHGWLKDLSANVPIGGSWTPSFVLVRERCFRLGLRGAWAAAAFGEPAIARYLRAIAPGVVPLRVFDAVLGLAAIAIRHAELALPIRCELAAAIASVEAAAPAGLRYLYQAMSRSAELVLVDPERARRWTEARASRSRSGARRGGTIRQPLNGDEDCAQVEDGLFPCIVALPSVVPASAEGLFPLASELASQTAKRPAVHERARDVLLRTGAPSSDGESRERWVN